MKTLRIVATSIFGLCLTLVLLFSVASAADKSGNQDLTEQSASLQAAAGGLGETDLTPDSDVYELNDDGRGYLWLSEYGEPGNAVWQINHATGAYTIFNGFDGPDDARRDSGDFVWLSEYDGGNLARIDINTGIVTTWTLPGMNYPWGITFDESGHVWITDEEDPILTRFNMTSTQNCTYTVPNGGTSDYIHYDAGHIWIGDQENDGIAKLNTSNDQYTYYQLPGDARVQGFEFADDGTLWYTDYSNPELGHFVPSESKLFTYSLPFGEDPSMIFPDGPVIRYTEADSYTFGFLNPSTAVSVSTVLTSATMPLTQTCVTLGPGITRTATISTGVLAFEMGHYTQTENSEGWQVFQLPDESDPYALTSVNNTLWIGDMDRDRLLKFGLPDIVVHKSPFSQTVESGESANFTVYVTNTGGITLANVTVVDSLTEACDSDLGTLGINTAISFICNEPEVTSDFTSTVVVTGSPDYGAGPPYPASWDVKASGTALVKVDPLDSTYLPNVKK